MYNTYFARLIPSLRLKSIELSINKYLSLITCIKPVSQVALLEQEFIYNFKTSKQNFFCILENVNDYHQPVSVFSGLARYWWSLLSPSGPSHLTPQQPLYMYISTTYIDNILMLTIIDDIKNYN